MKITLTHINNLLKLFESGLVNGAGHDVNHFCVQQAVHRVLDNDLDDAQKSDRPPTWCVREDIRTFGIHLNDEKGWRDEKARAEGLKRFAIAELGSSEVWPSKFYEKLAVRLASMSDRDPEEFSHDAGIINDFVSWSIGGMTRNDKLTRVANAAADVLMELGTEGSQFLYLIDEPDKQKREEKARALGHKIYAAQLADVASHYHYGVPQQSKHHIKK